MRRLSGLRRIRQNSSTSDSSSELEEEKSRSFFDVKPPPDPKNGRQGIPGGRSPRKRPAGCAIFPDQVKPAKLRGFFLIKMDVFRKGLCKTGIFSGVGTISTGTFPLRIRFSSPPSENSGQILPTLRSPSITSKIVGHGIGRGTDKQQVILYGSGKNPEKSGKDLSENYTGNFREKII
jgi:hypothetical protein